MLSAFHLNYHIVASLYALIPILSVRSDVVIVSQRIEEETIRQGV
jgi:hypothetical protein